MDIYNKKILLIDDEEAILFALSRLLKGHGVSVDTAATAPRAYELLASNTYCAIIADVRLAGSEKEEGLEIIRSVRPRNSGIFIIVMTAFGGADTYEKVMASGADYYLEKPVYPQKIRALLVEQGIYSIASSLAS